MKPATHPIRTTSLAAVMTLGLAMPAAAQTAAGGGRALDANPQVGSGGVNDTQGQIDFRIRNDVVTGNVSGGREFRGEVGYRAPGEFSDQLGSDDLFDFQRQSLSSDPRRLDAVNTYRNFTSGGGTSVYRTYTSLPSVRPLMAPGPTNTTIALEGYTVADPSRLVGGNLLGGVSTAAESRLGVLGTFQQPDGRTLELNASPLLGLRVDLRPELRLDLVPEVRPGLLPPTLDEDVPTEEEEALDRSLRPTTQLEPMGYEADAEAAFAEPARVAPGLLLGQQMQATTVGIERADRGDAVTQQRLERLGRSLFERGRRDAEPGEDPYLDLLRSVREGQQQEAAPREGDRLVAPPEPEEQEAEADREPRTLAELREPTEREVEQAESARQEALQRMWERHRGIEAEDEQAPPDGRTAPGQLPDIRLPQFDDEEEPTEQGEAPESERTLSELMTQLDYELPPLESLAGTRETRTNQMMQQAEQELASGQYFAAEGLYRQTLIDNPNQPLARAGLVHAQLGAGMIRSAALNLRKLFEEHPELIAARYDASLLPSGERLRWVQQELQRMINSQRDATADPGLMMAYLGYQTGSRQLMRYGLAVAESRSPRDPLMPVLRRIWLGEADATDAAPAEQPATPTPGADDGGGMSEPAGK